MTFTTTVLIALDMESRSHPIAALCNGVPSEGQCWETLQPSEDFGLKHGEQHLFVLGAFL